MPSQEGSRPTHRLRKRSLPYTAEAALNPHQDVQSLHAVETDPSGSAIAGQNAAVPGAIAPDAAGVSLAGPDAAGHTTAWQVAASPYTTGLTATGLDVAEPASLHTLSDATPHASAAAQAILSNSPASAADASASCSAVDMEEAAVHCSSSSTIVESPAPQQLPASVTLAATPRLRGLRFPWLTNQAGHGSDQVSPSLRLVC